MAMEGPERYWLADAPFEKLVRIEMRRRETASATQMDAPSGAVETIARIAGTWVQRGGAHYLRHGEDWDVSGDEREPASSGAEDTNASNRGARHGDGDKRGRGEGGGGADRTIWKIEDSQLTMIRHGVIRWNLRFGESLTAESTAFFGDTPVPVHVSTRELSIAVDGSGGRVHVAWDAQVGGDAQSVRLDLRFWEVE